MGKLMPISYCAEIYRRERERERERERDERRREREALHFIAGVTMTITMPAVECRT